MNGLKAALVVVVGTALAACQQTPEIKAADASAQTLEERVAALEQQAPPSAAAPADPAGLTISPKPGAGSSYVERSAPPYVEQAAPAAPARRSAATSRRATRAPRTASATRPVAPRGAEPVERIGPAAEPIESVEPMADTGDPGPRRDSL